MQTPSIISDPRESPGHIASR